MKNIENLNNDKKLDEKDINIKKTKINEIKTNEKKYRELAREVNLGMGKYAVGCWVPTSFIPNYTYGNKYDGFGVWSAFVDNGQDSDNDGVYRLYEWFNSSSYSSWAQTCLDAFENGYSLTITYVGSTILSVSI